MKNLISIIIPAIFFFVSCDAVSVKGRNDSNTLPDNDSASVTDEDSADSDELENDENSLNDEDLNDEIQDDATQNDDIADSDSSISDNTVEPDDTVEQDETAEPDDSVEPDNTVEPDDTVEPDNTVEPDEDNTVPDEDAAGETLITIGTYNLENFFDTECDSGTDGSGNCYDMELLTISEYNSKLASLETSIRSINSDIQIIVEIEDDTAGSDLLSALSDIYDDFYVAIKYDGSQNVGVLTKGTITNVIDHGSETDFAREFPEIHIDIDDSEVIVFPAHFKSKSNDDPARRLREATKAAEIINTVAQNNPDALIVLGGDLNDEPGSDPLNALDSANLLRTASDLPLNDQCTYNYYGCSKIDHLYLSLVGAGEYVAGSSQVIKDGGCGSGPYCLGSSDHSALKAVFKLNGSVIPDPETDSIYDIKQSIIPDGTTVKIKGVVTAVSGNSFFVQTMESDYDIMLQEEYSAVFVYISSSVTPSFTIPTHGDIVEVSATTDVYYGQIQLGYVTDVIIKGSTAIPAPLLISPSSVRSAPYEGVLVDVGSVTVSSLGSYGDFTVTGGLVVDDDMYSISPTVGESYSLKGVMKYSFSEYRLLPRNSFDVQEM